MPITETSSVIEPPLPVVLKLDNQWTPVQVTRVRQRYEGGACVWLNDILLPDGTTRTVANAMLTDRRTARYPERRVAQEDTDD